MKSKRILNTRQWLNPKSSSDTGAISVTATAEAYGVEAEVVIRDCARQITLDFSFCGKTELKQRTVKLNKIITDITRLRDSLPEAFEAYREMKDDE